MSKDFGLIGWSGDMGLVGVELGFVPRGFTSTGSAKQKQQLLKWKILFEPYGLYDFDRTGGGADIRPLSKQGTFLIGLLPDGQRYFRYHHTEKDVFEAVVRELP